MCLRGFRTRMSPPRPGVAVASGRNGSADCLRQARRCKICASRKALRQNRRSTGSDACTLQGIYSAIFDDADASHFTHIPNRALPQTSRQQFVMQMCHGMVLNALDVTVAVHFHRSRVRFKDGCQFGALDGRIRKLRQGNDCARAGR